MPPQGHVIQVIHAGAAEGTVGDRKAGRLDDVRSDAKAGAKPQNRSRILSDIRLVKREMHCDLIRRGKPAGEGETSCGQSNLAARTDSARVRACLWQPRVPINAAGLRRLRLPKAGCGAAVRSQGASRGAIS